MVVHMISEKLVVPPMFCALVLGLQVMLAASSGAHGTGPVNFEWAGIFATPEDTYVWTAQKTKGSFFGQTTWKYADATMKMAVLPVSAATETVLHAEEGEGNHSLTMTCTNVAFGGTISPMEDKCYTLQFEKDSWQTLFFINTAGHEAVAIFTEHFPTEFERTAHYLKDDHGDDIEPVAELPEKESDATASTVTTAPHEDEDKSYWGPAIAASIIVNMITLLGVVMLVPALARTAKTYAAQFECMTSGFAAGAISSCAFFLLLFESTHLIATDHKKEVEQIWRWGTMILSGALFPAIAHLVVELVVPGKKAAATPENGNGADNGEVQIEVEKIEKTPVIASNSSTKARLMSSVLIGDFLHNLCDGFFVGAAFKGCGNSVGWSVAAGTIAHELAQELADYMVLTGKECRLHPAVALAINFLSGTGVLLGVIIVCASDVGNGDIGLLLAFGGGTYLYIAFVECMPKIQSHEVSSLVRGCAISLFILGAIAIGLVLLDHEHCVPPAPPGSAPVDPHAGHNH
jgi:zinc transporter ZupT